MDYIKKLEELTEAVRKVEAIVKEMNEEKQAISCVAVIVPDMSFVRPELRTETESEIVCYSGFSNDEAFVLSEIAETEFDEKKSYYFCTVNGIEVNQWGKPKQRNSVRSKGKGIK